VHTNRNVTNATVRENIGLPVLSSRVSSRVQVSWLRFCRHVARSDSKQDHHRVVIASFPPLSHWRRPRGRPSATWMRGLMMTYSRLTLGSTQPAGRSTSTIVYALATYHPLPSMGHATKEFFFSIKCQKNKMHATPKFIKIGLHVIAWHKWYVLGHGLYSARCVSVYAQ